MGWEERGNHSYYYRKRREEDRVISEYVGGGVVALLAEQHDAEERRERQREIDVLKEQERADNEIDDILKDIEYRLKAVTKAHLLNLGFHQTSSREWRFSNDKDST